MSQLDKEGGELRDENSMLHIRLQALEELAAGDWKTKVRAVNPGCWECLPG
jgi:hypothetical protein